MSSAKNQYFVVTKSKKSHFEKKAIKEIHSDGIPIQYFNDIISMVFREGQRKSNFCVTNAIILFYFGGKLHTDITQCEILLDP